MTNTNMTNYEKIKLGGKIAKALALLIAGLGVYFYAGAYADSVSLSAPSITVTGTGKVIAKPDVARFSFAIQTDGGKDIAALQKQNDDRSNKIVNFLKSKGIPADDIKTTNYSMTPRYQSYACGPEIYTTMPAPAIGAFSDGSVGSGVISRPAIRPCPPSSVVGYSFNNTVEVTARDFATKNLGDLLSGVVANGATNVSQLSFEQNDPDATRTLAKAEAISKAKASAKLLAGNAGISLGRIISIDEYGSPMPYYAAKNMLGIGGGAPVADSAPAIEPGSREVSVTVNVRYALK